MDGAKSTWHVGGNLELLDLVEIARLDRDVWVAKLTADRNNTINNSRSVAAS